MGQNNNQPIVGQDGKGTEGTTVKSTSSASTKNPGRGRPRGTTTERKSTEKSVELSNVDSPKIVAVEIPKNEEQPTETKKGRGRPPGTKKKNAAAKKPSQADHTHIQILLLTVSGVIASKPNMSMFALTSDEAEQIAKPLSNILAKNESVNAVTSEYADHIALLFAAATIFVGKYLAYRTLNPKPKKKGAKKNEQERPINSSHTGNDPGPSNPGTPETNHNTFNGQLNSILTPIGGI